MAGVERAELGETAGLGLNGPYGRLGVVGIGEETRARWVHGLVEYLKSDSGVTGGLEEDDAWVGVDGAVFSVFGFEVVL